MSPSIIEKMGFEKDDRVVIVHIDDMAMSHAANEASFECLEFGIASCGSVIAPAPWLMEAALKYQKNKHFDVGVHLTLTCEYDTYRWRPLSSVDPKTGLFDEEGYFWKTVEQAAANVDPEAATEEMRSQIELALHNGIDVTHIDSHMGTIFHPKFIQGYLSIAKEYRVPALLPRPTKELIEAKGLGEYTDLLQGFMKQLEKSELPFIDYVVDHPLGKSEERTTIYMQLFDSLKPGLTHLYFHPAKNRSELKALSHHSIPGRHEDYLAFTDPKLKEHVERIGVKIIGYREIRKFIRENL
ncbi:MAG: polysaccharide deacetylase family protein [Candidatus Hermodarchaeota archaeon]